MEENHPKLNTNRRIELGSRIRAARIGAGYRSQESFAKAIFPGVEDETDSLDSKRKKISNWESGASAPNIDDVAVLCDALNCDVGYLFGEYEEKRKEISNVTAITGLSEKAIYNLQAIGKLSSMTFHNNIGCNILGLLSDLLEDLDAQNIFQNIGFYLYYKGCFPEEAYPQATRSDSFEGLDKAESTAAGFGQVIIRKDGAAELYLNMACDSLKKCARKIADDDLNKKKPPTKGGKGGK